MTQPETEEDIDPYVYADVIDALQAIARSGNISQRTTARHMEQQLASGRVTLEYVELFILECGE